MKTRTENNNNNNNNNKTAAKRARTVKENKKVLKICIKGREKKYKDKKITATAKIMDGEGE